MQKFEKGFFVGAATAAHQVEGNNIHSDYWAQEQLPHTSFTEPSGIACDHYNKYEEDIKLLADAGLNAYRFSIEWARIEPEEGKFDPAEIEHYRKVIACCKAHGVEPVVTLLHFTSPKWLIAKGGWEAESTVEYFKRYVSYVMEQLGSELHIVCTINEANMGLQLAAISKRFRLMAEQAAKAAANAGKSAEGSVQVGMNFQKMMENMKYAAAENAAVFGTPQPKIFVSERTPEGDLLVLRAHAAAREAIKTICPEVKVGLTLSLHDLQAHVGLIDGADDVQLTAQLLHHIADIVLEVFDRGFCLPAALGNQPFGAGEVQQRRNRFNAVRLAAGNDLAVMLDFGRVEPALLRLDTRPFDGKAIGVQPGIRQQSNIFLIPIIMVAGNAARLSKAGVGQLLLCPVVRMNVVALDLMGGSGRADKETFFKFLHNFLLTCAV